MEQNQVKWHERISYGLTDTGYNLVYMMVANYLLYFYTDVFEVNPITIAPLFLIARIIDGITDPLEGILIDRVNTCWGKCRPFWLWFSIPFGIFGVLVFSAPDLSEAGKIVYIYVTYIGLNLLISLVSLPISAILPSLSSNTNERMVINAVRMVCQAIGSIIVAAAGMPLVAVLGQGDEKKGFLLTILIFATITITLFLNGWAQTRERVKPANEASIPIKQGLKSILNTPWFIMLGLTIIANMSLTLRNQSAIYYLTYNLNRPELTSAMLTLPTLFMLISVVVAPPIAKRMGKKKASMLGMFISIAGNIIILISESSVFLLFAGSIIAYMGLGIFGGLAGAMFADTVDYIEWKSGVRSTGIIYSANSLGTKTGQGLGSAFGAILLSIGHYIPNTSQTASSLASIKFSFVWVFLIAILLITFLLNFYKVDDLYPLIQNDLEKRRLQ